MNKSEIIVERLTEYSDEVAAGLGKLMPGLSERFSDEPIEENLLQAIIDSSSHEQLIARLEGRIVGAATMNLIMGPGTGKKGELEDFVTDSDVRGKGIGDKVWQEMLAWCRENGVNFDFTSHPSRKAAHRFYKSHGATIRETIVFHVDVE